MDKAKLKNKILELDKMSQADLEYNFIGDVEMEWEPEVLELYLERGVSVNFKTPSGNSALIEVAAHSNTNLVKFFLSKGADVNIVDGHGRTPLGYSALFGDHEVSKVLIEAGADIEFVDEDESSILGVSLKRAINQPQNSIVVKQLIEAGVNLDKKIQGDTPLFLASKAESFEICKLFVEAGVDVNVTNENGLTPLSAAYSSPKIIEFLIGHGADVNYVNPWKNTALTTAAKVGALETMNLLIEAGGDVNDPRIDPIVFEAVKWGKLEMVKLLISKGADLSGTNEEGKTIQEMISDRTCKETRALISTEF